MKNIIHLAIISLVFFSYSSIKKRPQTISKEKIIKNKTNLDDWYILDRNSSYKLNFVSKLIGKKDTIVYYNKNELIYNKGSFLSPKSFVIRFNSGRNPKPKKYYFSGNIINSNENKSKWIIKDDRGD